MVATLSISGDRSSGGCELAQFFVEILSTPTTSLYPTYDKIDK